MTLPELSTTRPAALTGTISQGGLNRVHDVALVQALLGAKRAKGGRPYRPGRMRAGCPNPGRSWLTSRRATFSSTTAGACPAS